jgi:adenylylsulfate reductase subunit A
MKLDDKNWHVLTVSHRDPKTGEYTMEKAPLYHLTEDEDKEEAA